MDIVDDKPTNFLKILERAKELTLETLPHLDDSTLKYYVNIDEPRLAGYKAYVWSPESANDSIWLVGGGIDPCPIEEAAPGSAILAGLRVQHYLTRLVVHEKVRNQLKM